MLQGEGEKLKKAIEYTGSGAVGSKLNWSQALE